MYMCTIPCDDKVLPSLLVNKAPLCCVTTPKWVRMQVSSPTVPELVPLAVSSLGKDG